VVTEDVGVTAVIKQSKVAVKSKVSQYPVGLGVGVTHNVLNIFESKSGQTFVLGEGPNKIQSPPVVKERHHLVVPVLK